MAESKAESTTQMLINYVPGEECRVAVVEGAKLEEFHAERASSISRVGNIYVGVVTNVEPAIQAAFIDFGIEHHGFLHVTDIHPRYFPGEDDDTTERVGRKTPRRERPPIQKCFRRGDEVVVQVLKEGVGTKGPTLTSYLSIPGRFLVMMPQMDRVGVSRKVEDEDQRRAMRAVLDQLELPEGFGFIVRTAGMDRTKLELKRDLAYLMRLWKDMEIRHKGGNRPRLLYSESDLLVRALRDMLGPEIEEVVIDNDLALARASRFLKIVAPRSKVSLKQYEGHTPLFHAFGVEQQIAMMHAREVPLPGGGRLVIDETEALVAIDVNSGKMRDARDAETNAYRTNVEAVEEICRQIKLRDLGGIIINDLIDMRHASHRKDIEQRFRDRLKRDRARSTTLAISDFGILEMTRQRMRGSHESVHFVDCPTCRGRGMVQKPDSIAADALRNLAAALDHDNVARIEMVVSPRVASELLSGRRKSLNQLERKSGKHVDVRVSETVPIDRVTFYAYDAAGADIDVESLSRPRPPTQLKVWELGTKDDEAWAADLKEEETPPEPDLTPAEQEELADLPTHPIEVDDQGEPVSLEPGNANLDGQGQRKRRRRRRGRRGRGGEPSGPDGQPPHTPQQQQQHAPHAPHLHSAPAQSHEPLHHHDEAHADGAPHAQSSEPNQSGAAGPGGEEGGPRRRRRRRRRRGRGGEGAPALDGAQNGAPEAQDHPFQDAELPTGEQGQTLDDAPRGDSWDVPGSAVPPLRTGPAVHLVQPDEKADDSADDVETTQPQARGGQSPDEQGPQGEGGGRRRRRRRGRRGRGGARPEGEAPAPVAPVPPAAPQPVQRQPQPPQQNRPPRAGGGYQKRPPAAPAPPAPKPAPVHTEPKPVPTPAPSKRFLYTSRRKLAPGEIKNMPRE